MLQLLDGAYKLTEMFEFISRAVAKASIAVITDLIGVTSPAAPQEVCCITRINTLKLVQENRDPRTQNYLSCSKKQPAAESSSSHLDSSGAIPHWKPWVQLPPPMVSSAIDLPAALDPQTPVCALAGTEPACSCSSLIVTKN